MDHVDRLLAFRELRAIVKVLWSVFTTEKARVPCGGKRNSLELAVRWGGVHRSSGYLKEKAKGRDELRLSFEWSED
jgi:hypothetical protein